MALSVLGDVGEEDRMCEEDMLLSEIFAWFHLKVYFDFIRYDQLYHTIRQLSEKGFQCLTHSVCLNYSLRHYKITDWKVIRAYYGKGTRGHSEYLPPAQ